MVILTEDGKIVYEVGSIEAARVERLGYKASENVERGCKYFLKLDANWRVGGKPGK